MYKNIIIILFFILIVGCDNDSSIMGPDYRHDNFSMDYENYLSLKPVGLKKDLNGYYKGKFILPDYAPYGMFIDLKVETNCNLNQPINWSSNYYYTIDHLYEQWVEYQDLVNDSTTYVDDFGESLNILSVWPDFIGDTIIVRSNFIDEYNIIYEDSIKIILTMPGK